MSGEDQQQRAERLAAALRENLKRRKAQARGRKDDAPARDTGDATAGSGADAGEAAVSEPAKVNPTRTGSE
ncbi:hypothetical protein [Ancylobacter mangrovi]|uniref:hypothetical protein n=1 Tax=Ancylobacter mangrovi TaxID=2972472 RepID=UPI002161D96E|nr:hypothetical protein [Ancylobacter mangrovi]MCS0503388.1 hypothetical protein [Ancylobacter mangrovi]